MATQMTQYFLLSSSREEEGNSFFFFFLSVSHFPIFSNYKTFFHPEREERGEKERREDKKTERRKWKEVWFHASEIGKMNHFLLTFLFTPYSFPSHSFSPSLSLSQCEGKKEEEKELSK